MNFHNTYRICERPALWEHKAHLLLIINVEIMFEEWGDYFEHNFFQ